MAKRNIDLAKTCLDNLMNLNPKVDPLVVAQVYSILALVDAVEGVAGNLDYICQELTRHRTG